MQKGQRALAHFKRDSRGQSVHRNLACTLALFTLCLCGALLSLGGATRATTTNADAVQLVRLSVSTAGDGIRIEITADGSISDVVTETRGLETIIRVLSARSLLRSSYAVNDPLARAVRTTTGERDGVPFVEIVVTRTGDGMILAPRKFFNRLVIGVAQDSARLLNPRTQNKPREGTEAAAAGRVTKAKPFISRAEVESKEAEAILTTDTLPPINAPVTNSAPLAITASASHAPVALASSRAAKASPPLVFRGREIWATLPDSSSFFHLKPIDSSRVPLLFLQAPTAVAASTQNKGSAAAPLNFITMTLAAPGATVNAWMPGTTAAETDRVGGRALGAGFLRPSFALGAEYNSNFFYRSIVGSNLGIFTFAPRIEYEVPGETSALRVAYEARLRRLTNGNWANGQTLDFDSRFELAPTVRVALRNHFVRSALDAREYDPAGETYIEGDTFTRNDSAARAELTLNARNRLALDLGYNFVRWSDRYIANAPLFVNYAELRPAISAEHDVSERTTALAEISYTDTNASVPLRAEFGGLNDRRQIDFIIGARAQMSGTSSFAFRAGFERSVSPNASADNDFSGLVFDAAYRREWSEKTNFQLAVLRKTQISSFNPEGGNARLLSTGAAARFEKNQTKALQLGFEANYQRLSFPVAIIENSTASGGLFVGDFAGTRRRDSLYGFGLNAGYQFSDLLRARLAYNFARRNSNIPLLTFNRNLLSLIFEFGRRNDVRGRSF